MTAAGGSHGLHFSLRKIITKIYERMNAARKWTDQKVRTCKSEGIGEGG